MVKLSEITQYKKIPLMNRFMLFSIVLFLFLLVTGSVTFVLTLQQIIRTNKGNELSQLLEIERIKLESSINKEISLALKMASSPLIQNYFAEPENSELEKIAFEEIASYRRAFAANSVFWVNDKDKKFYLDNKYAYSVDTRDSNNYWYLMTLNKTEKYNFNINYNPDLEVTNLWINAPVFDSERKAIGILGTGINLSEFVNAVYKNHVNKAEFYFFNAAGEITGAKNLDIVAAKKKVNEKLSETGTDIVAHAKNLKPGEKQTLDTKLGRIAIGTVPLLEWYSIALMPDSISDYKISTTILFIVMMTVMAIIFVIFNIFILGLLRPLRKTMDDLKAASNAKSDFLAKMSHEIRTPMNAIIGMAELALRENMASYVREHIVTIKQASTNLLSIINDILDFSKIESGKLEIVPIDYMLSSLVNDVINIIRMRIIDSGLRFEINIDSNIPSALFGDEIRIRQMLLNILSNAVKYTKKGFISFTVNGEIIDDTVLLTIEVTDSGIGIKKEDLEKLFDDFVRLDFAANRGVEGTGLGLAITKNLVKAMGGDISVCSEYGKGSTFTIKLPQKINSHKPLGTIKTLEEHSRDNIIVKFNAPKARILIVDDISTNLKVAEGLMLPYKMQIDLCLSGTEAIEAVSKNRYDLVFMDHMMPEMNGIEATKLIREMGSENPRYVNLPIVALTANAVSGAKEMFLSNDFNDFLSKPIDIIKLNTILEKWLPKEKQEKTNEEAKIADAGDDDSEIMKIEIEGVDIKKGISMMGGKFKNYLQTLAVFHKDGIQKIEEIRECLKTNNYSLYATYAHALKSALMSIGASELSENAKALEMAGKQKDAAFISSNNAQFLKNLETLLNNLGNAFSSVGKDEQKNSVDFEFLRNELNGLKEALKVFNSVAIDKATNNLQKFTQADNIGTNVQNILQNILIGEYDDAAVMIDSLILLL